MDDWTEFLASGGQIGVIYTDSAKAFDKVQKLLAKLRSYRITKEMLIIITSTNSHDCLLEQTNSKTLYFFWFS